MHAHVSVAELHHGKKYSHVGLGTGMRLHIRILTAEKFFGSLDRQGLYDINILASAVVALPGITFCILIGKVASHRCHDRLGNKVLRGDQLKIIPLTVQLILHRCRNFRVCLLYIVKFKHIFLHSNLVVTPTCKIIAQGNMHSKSYPSRKNE